MARKIDTDAEIYWERLKDQVGDPASPGAGYKYFYSKAGGLYVVNSAGAVTGPLGAGGASITTDTYANIPAAGTAGNLFLPSDGYSEYRDTGAAWAPWGPLFPLTKPPAISTLTWVNQGAGTASETNGGIYMYNPADSNDNWRMLLKTLTAPYTLTVAMINHYANFNYHCSGLVWRQASDGKLVTWGYSAEGDGVLRSSKWNSATNWSAGYYASNATHLQGPLFLRMEDDNVNRIISWSTDGQNFRVSHTVGRTDFMTATQVGIGINCTHASDAIGALFISWKET